MSKTATHKFKQRTKMESYGTEMPTLKRNEISETTNAINAYLKKRGMSRLRYGKVKRAK